MIKLIPYHKKKLSERQGGFVFLTPKKEWLSNMSNLAPKYCARAFANISWYISDPRKGIQEQTFSIVGTNPMYHKCLILNLICYIHTWRTREQNARVHSCKLWGILHMLFMFQVDKWGCNQHFLRILTETREQHELNDKCILILTITKCINQYQRKDMSE